MTTLATPAPLSRFERFLTPRVALCFVAGIVTVGDPLAVPILVQVLFSTSLAAAVGVLIEVPVMLLVVRVVNGAREWYEAPRG